MVSITNAPPQFAAVPAFTVPAGTSRSIPLTVSSTFRNQIALSATSLPAFASLSPAAAGGTLVLNPKATDLGNYGVTIVAQDNGSPPLLSTLTVSFTVGPPVSGTPRLNLSATGLDFAVVVVGQTKDLTLSMNNDGTASLTVSSLTVTGAGFSIVNLQAPLVIASGASNALTLRFSPTIAGSQTGALTITSNDPARASLTVPLSGMGGASAGPGPGTALFSDSFQRGDADPCSLGRADLALGGGGAHYYLPLFPSSAGPIGARIVSGVVQNVGLDYGGVQFTSSTSPCSGGRGENLGQDLNIRVDLFVPTDTGLHIGAAGPYFRSRAAAAGDGIIGGASAGYWVSLSNGGAVRVYKLNPDDVVALGQVRGFDATAYHRLEIAARGSGVQVPVDGAPINFFLSTGFTTTVPIPATGGSNDGTAGIAFGATDSRGLIGGQRAKNLVVSPYAPLNGGASSTPKIAVTPANLDFSAVTVGQNKTLTVTVSNSSDATLTVRSMGIAASAFTVVSPAMPFNVLPGGSQAVSVLFAPPATGPASGTLTISSNDPLIRLSLLH